MEGSRKELTDEEVAYFEQQEKDKRPLKLIISLFVLLVLIFSFIPYYVMKLDPNPNYEKLDAFSLEEARELAPEIRGHAASIQSAPAAINIGDYRILAARIATESCTWESDVCYTKALFYFVQDKMKYVSDPERQYVQLPSETLVSGAYDCEDASFLLATLLEAIGVDADVGITHDHAFVRAQIPSALWQYKSDEDYVYLDPTCGSCKFGEFRYKPEEIKGFVEL